MYSQWTRAVRRLTVSIPTTLLLCLWGSASYGAEPTGIEEVIVTGTKREATVQDTPIAVTALTGEQLEKQFRNDILALNDMSPGVALAQVAGFRAVAGGVRGTGQNSILVTQDSSVVVLIDEFALSNVQSQFVEMFDIERVEVYRGPQGTLFGKSATGGAISIISKRPVMNEMFAEVGGQWGQFNPDGGDKGDIGKVRMALNVPLLDDTLAIRAAAIYDYDEGYYTNDKNTAIFPDTWLGIDDAPFPDWLSTRTTGSGENLNGTDTWAGKVKALWQPNDRYEAYFIWEILRDESDSPPGVNESEPFHLLPLLGFPSIQAAGQSNELSTGVTNQCVEGNEDGLCVTKGHRVDVDGYYLHQQLSLDPMTLKLMIGYRKQDEILPSTYTGEAFTSLFDASRNTQRENWQVELRGTTNFDGPFNMVAGASYSDDQTDMLAYATVGLSGLLPDNFVDLDRDDGIPPDFIDPATGQLNMDQTYFDDITTTGASQDRKTYAVYADGTFEVSERLRVSAGLRYTYDEKDFYRRANAGGPCTAETPLKHQQTVDGECADIFSNAISRVGGGFSAKDLDNFTLPLPGSAYGINAKLDDDWDEITWRAVVDFDVLDNMMVYGSYATGFIPGGFTETCSRPASCAPFDSETNWNVEIGSKGRYFDDTLQLNVAVFYTEYEDLVRSQVIPFADEFGRVTQETININAGKSQAYGIEAESTWLPLPQLQVIANVGYLDHDYDDFAIGGEDLSDRTVPFSPEWKAGLGATYDQMLGSGTITYGASLAYQDDLEMSVFNSPRTQIESRTLVDANISYSDGEDRYRLTLWGKNLTDERTRVAANSVAGLWNFTMYDRPMSYGVDVSFFF